MRKQTGVWVLALLCLLAMVRGATAQPLADRVPADAIVYFAWCGSETIPPTYSATHFKAIVDNSKLQELFTEFLPRLGDRIVQSNRDAREPIAMARAIGGSVWTHPTAFFFSGVDMTNPRQPMPRLGLICKAGADAAGIQQRLRQIMAGAPPVVQMVQVDDLIILSIGYRDPSKLIAEGGGAIKDAPGFVAAMKQVQPNPMLSSYVDLEKGIATIEQLTRSDPQIAAMVAKVIDALGIRGLKRMSSSSGFDGADWVSQSFLEMSGPRTGLLEGISADPLTPELLAAIPMDATFAAAGRFDAAKFITDLRSAAGKVDPQAQRIFDQALGAVQIAIARNPVTDVLEPLGRDWAVYCSPSAAGNGLLGMVIVNRLDDPAKASASLPIAFTNLSNWANVGLRRNKVDIQFSLQTADIEGAKVYYAGTPAVAPAWTIKSGNLYMGLYPQSAAAGTGAVARAGGKSLAENPKFIALKQRLGVTNPSGFTFMDLPSEVASGGMYQKLLAITRYGGIADLFGVPLPEPMLPPLSVLQQHTTPSGGFKWIDATGVHYKSVTPYPGASLFSEPAMLTTTAPATSAMLVSILLPSLNRARETANRVKCAAQEKAIANAILMYSNDNRGNYPPDMVTLATYLENNGFGRGTLLLCPSGDPALPPNIAQMTIEQYATWANDNSSYIYIGGGLTNRTATADTIVLYEKPDDHSGDGMNLLYGDGHVDWLPMQQALADIQKQQARQVK